MKLEDIKGKKLAIHCPTQELARKVGLLFGEYKDSWWESYKERFVLNSTDKIHGSGRYGAFNGFYKNEGYTIISAEDFLRANSDERICFNYLIL